MKKIIAGVFGCGRIGKMHIENLLKEDLTIKVVYDLKIDHLESWAAEHNITLTDNEEVLLNDNEINTIFIFSSTNTHIPNILKVASKADYVFCEKPVSMDTNEALEAWKTLKQYDDKIQIGFNRRFDHSFALLKNKVNDNLIGKLNILKITSRDPEPPGIDYLKVSGGIFLDMAIHDFDMARFVANSEVEWVHTMGDCLIDEKIASVGDIDTATIQLQFKNKTLGLIDISRKAAYGYDQRIEAFGLDGMLKAENVSTNTLTTHTSTGAVVDNPPYFFIERYQQAYQNEYKAFLDSVHNNKPVVCKLSDGIKASLIADAVKESLLTKKQVSVKTL